MITVQWARVTMTESIPVVATEAASLARAAVIVALTAVATTTIPVLTTRATCMGANTYRMILTTTGSADRTTALGPTTRAKQTPTAMALAMTVMDVRVIHIRLNQAPADVATMIVTVTATA